MAKYEPDVRPVIHEIAMECAMSKLRSVNLSVDKSTREKHAVEALEEYVEIFNVLMEKHNQ